MLDYTLNLFNALVLLFAHTYIYGGHNNIANMHSISSEIELSLRKKYNATIIKFINISDAEAFQMIFGH